MLTGSTGKEKKGFMTSRVTKERNHFDNMAGVYERYYGYDHWYTTKKIQKKSRLMIDSCEIRDDAYVLELGCGTGLYTRELGKTGAKIIASDLSEKMLKIGMERCQDFGVAFVQTDIRRLPFRAEVFDAVIGAYILHHVELEACLPEIKRVLKDGGRIAFWEPNMLNPVVAATKKIGFIKRRVGDSPEETAFLKWRLQGIFEQHGFTNLKFRTSEFVDPSIIPSVLLPLTERVGNLLEKTPLLREFGGSLFISGMKFGKGTAKASQVK
jgi:ubiquinone/menaquinone biosynthesis C-methylase UbiE